MEPLTATERKVLALKIAGRSLREIGDQLGFSAERARTYRDRAKQKFLRTENLGFLLSIGRILEAAELDLRSTLHPSQVTNLFAFFNKDMRTLLQAEAKYIASRVPSMGPKVVKKLEACLKPYGLRLGMSEGEIAAVDTRAVGEVP